MKLICAVLGNYLNLCAAVAAVLSRISARSNLYFFNAFLRWGNNGGTSPRLTVDAGAIDFKIVCRQSLTVSSNLNLVFCGEDPEIRTARSTCVRQVSRRAVSCSGAVSKNTRSKTRQLVR